MKCISREHAEQLAMKWAESRYNPPQGYSVDWEQEIHKYMEQYEPIIKTLEPYIL